MVIQRKLDNGGSLLDWCKEHGKYGEILQSEFMGEDINGNKIEMSEITYGSCTKVKWRYASGYEFYQSPLVRTHGHTGCTHRSSIAGTSFPEQFIYWCFKQIWDNAENRCHVLKTAEHPQGIEFDIGVPSIRLCIEYSSAKWHKGKEEYDNYKKEVCKANNVRLINIIEYESSHMVEIVEDDDIYYIKNGAKQDKLIQIVDDILKQYGHSIQDIDTELAYENAYEHSRNILEEGKSLKDVYPELAKEFNEKLNTVNIKSVTQRSGLEIYWTCPKCGHGQNGEWKATVHSRTRDQAGTGCPKCGWNWEKQNYNKVIILYAEKNCSILST